MANRHASKASPRRGAAAAATVTVEDDAWRAALADAFTAADEEFLKEADRRKWDDGTCACAVGAGVRVFL